VPADPARRRASLPDQGEPAPPAGRPRPQGRGVPAPSIHYRVAPVCCNRVRLPHGAVPIGVLVVAIQTAHRGRAGVGGVVRLRALRGPAGRDGLSVPVERRPRGLAVVPIRHPPPRRHAQAGRVHIRGPSVSAGPRAAPAPDHAPTGRVAGARRVVLHESHRPRRGRAALRRVPKRPRLPVYAGVAAGCVGHWRAAGGPV